MPTEKKPAPPTDLNAQAPALRRGRGLRLSPETPAKPARASAARKASATASESINADHAASEVARPATRRKPAARATAAQPSAPAADLEAAAAPEAPAPDEPVEATAAPEASAPDEPERRKREFRLRKDLLKTAKQLARSQDRKLSELIETALEEYIQRHASAA